MKCINIKVLSGKKKKPLADGMTGVTSTAIAAAAEKSVCTGKAESVWT